MKRQIATILKKIGLFDVANNTYKKIEMKNNLTNKYKFEDRKNNKEKACFILAGYKEFLYDSVFTRVKKYVPDDVDVCILSSGKHSEKLSKIAKCNNWSYLSTTRNNVALIQNVAINVFSNAKYIYKIDEDIFITKNFFDTTLKTLEYCKEKSNFFPGIVAPTIPINGFANMIILERFNLKQVYEEKFEQPKCAAGNKRMIENNPKVAKFFWGDENYLPSIDKIDEELNKDKFDFVPCPIKFSIGAILFERELWKDMGMFHVGSGAGMGNDEKQICTYCMLASRPIIVSKNTAVGHLSFGPQNKEMKEYYLNRKIKEE